ncbi:unnamed protein product [Adineta ricciae]|uniref:Uncharacterized protein n=1 Tax=Adineta ricciae TaxID=249248 RepID=A0A814WAM7_ADIRI|nr:unnamed protein product [Adineta ricciae]
MVDGVQLSTTFFKAVLLSKFLFNLLPLSSTNVYGYLWRHYGNYTKTLFGELMKTRIEIFPTFVQFRVAIPRLANSKTIRQCQDNILRDELQFKREFLRQAAKHLARLDQALKEAVPHIIYVRLKSISTELVNKKLIIMQNKHKNKLDYLRAKYFAYVPERQTQLDPVKNLSDYILSEDEHDALVNGLNHVYAPEKFNQPQFVCDMEYFYSRLLNFKTPYRHYESKPAHLNISHKLTPTELNTASEIRQAANSFQKAAQTELKHFGKVNRKTFTALRSLAKNKSIVISRPDKGRGVVIMNRADYLRKMNFGVDVKDISTRMYTTVFFFICIRRRADKGRKYEGYIRFGHTYTNQNLTKQVDHLKSTVARGYQREGANGTYVIFQMNSSRAS